MLQRLLTIIFLIVSSAALAQNGTISGVVTDQATGETVIGANVVIQGTTVGTATDIDGKFAISNVKPGTYNVQVSFVTYKSHLIPDVVVESGKITEIKIQMHEDVSQLQEVVVTGTREINNDFSLIQSIKEAKLVVSGISAEQITRLPDRDAAQIAARVPGVTIADNRFILIRGVPERYNQVMMNGIIAPSTEIDKRSFSFDLIPSNAIDQMLIYKSGAANLPGDFAGGVIRMITKRPTEERYIKFGTTVGYRSNTTFGDYVSSEGSSTDVFGFDNGFRDLPSNFPTSTQLKATTRTSSMRERAGKSLTNNFDNTTTSAPLDMGANLTISQPFSLGSVDFKNVTILSYSNSYQRTSAAFKRYNSFDDNVNLERFSYTDNFYGNDVRVNAVHNWLIDFNDNFNIEFKNLFVQLGENETILRNGTDFYQLPNYDRQNYSYHYLSRSILSSQLEGNHRFGEKNTLNWVFGYNGISRNEPDFRRFRTIRDNSFRGTEEPFLMQLPAAGNLFETGRFWSDLNDKGYSNGVNFERKIGSDENNGSIQVGYFTEYKTRTFDARYMNYLYPDGPDFDPAVGEELRRLPLSDIFSPQNISNENGFVVEEGTTPQDHYEGSNLLASGYIGGSYSFGKLDLSGGFRAEYNRQELTSKSNQGGLIEVNNPVFAPLPMLNAAFNVSDRALLRAAYSRTVNRPEFRELAPFLYYNFEYEVAVYGNPDLNTAFVNNIDFRYELYPNAGELFSIGAFYKTFSNPIEQYLQITSENPQLYFDNAVSAYNYGAELEIRKSLASLGVSRILRNTSVNLNAAWIYSTVDIGAQATNQVDRPLQGQSPYILNAGLYYNDEETGFGVNAAYNVFGPRIYSVGDVLFPTWWEMPRHSMDFQISKTFRNRFETKLNIQNALNTPFRIVQDSNLDNKISENEAIIYKYQLGTQFSVGLSYRLSK
jgi:TonB-dependent receptor